MSRLPTPGGDDGAWGDILNDFLGQTHTSTGALKDNAVGAAQIQDGVITDAKISASAGIAKSKLASDVQTSLTAADNAIPASQKAAANGVASLNGSGKVPASQLAAPSVSTYVCTSTTETVMNPDDTVILTNADTSRFEAPLAVGSHIVWAKLNAAPDEVNKPIILEVDLLVYRNGVLQQTILGDNRLIPAMSIANNAMEVTASGPVSIPSDGASWTVAIQLYLFSSTWTGTVSGANIGRARITPEDGSPSNIYNPRFEIISF